MARRGWVGSLVLLALLVLVVVVAPGAGARRVQAEDEKAIKKKMQGWSREVGVKCSYCHVQQGRTYDYEADTPKKALAHYCEENFVKKLQIDKRAVSCADCHARKPRFLPREGEDATTPPPGEPDDEGEEPKKDGEKK